MIRAPDGTIMATRRRRERDGNWMNIQLARSPDLVHWQLSRRCASGEARLGLDRRRTSGRRTSIRDRDRYIMYYSAKPDTRTSGMGCASASRPRPLLPARSSTSAIRSSAARLRQHRPDGLRRSRDGQAPALLGLGFEPSRSRSFAPDRMSFAPGQLADGSRLAEPVKDAFPVLVEGSWLIRHGDFYYLFYSGDNCCGPKANYAVMVARSRSAAGPFETLEQATGKPHSIVLEKRGHWSRRAITRS